MLLHRSLEPDHLWDNKAALPFTQTYSNDSEQKKFYRIRRQHVLLLFLDFASDFRNFPQHSVLRFKKDFMENALN